MLAHVLRQLLWRDEADRLICEWAEAAEAEKAIEVKGW